jgi:hypothetical protein
MKENKVIRDRNREAAMVRKEQFSFGQFLRAERAKKETPYIIEDEETFRQKIQEMQENYLFWGILT